MKDFSKPAQIDSIQKAITKLAENNITAELVRSPEEAKEKIVRIIPEGSEIFTMSSATLEESGIAEVLNSDKYNSVRNKFTKLDRENDGNKMRRLGSAPNYAVGSVHAITEDGKLIIVSNTGSQLPAYAYGAEKVIYVVGAQKIVKDLEEAMQRIQEHTLPLESKRVQKAYGMPESAIRKWLIIDSEGTPERIHVIIVNEEIGY